jgi:hypothetical protein
MSRPGPVVRAVRVAAAQRDAWWGRSFSCELRAAPRLPLRLLVVAVRMVAGVRAVGSLQTRLWWRAGAPPDVTRWMWALDRERVASADC